MNIKAIIGSIAAVALLGFGIIVGGIAGMSSTAAQTSVTTPQTAPQTAPKTDPQTAPQQQTAPQTTSAKITQQQAEQAALAASPGNTIDHTRLGTDDNGTAIYDVDFTNGGGVIINAETGAVITTEAAGTDKGGHMGGRGGAEQAALAAKAKITKEQAEQTALTTSPGNTVDHSRLGQDSNGTIFWDVDFANGGGVVVNAETGAVITTEAAGTDMGGHGHMKGAPPATQP